MFIDAIERKKKIFRSVVFNLKTAIFKRLMEWDRGQEYTTRMNSVLRDSFSIVGTLSLLTCARL